MIILIAESKSMREDPRERGPVITPVALPRFEREAKEIMEVLSTMDAAKMESELHLGPKNAARLRREVYDFSHKSSGIPAVEAYSGVVFQALDYGTLEPQARERLQNNLFIVSTLYGILEPDNIIKNYRLDFNMKVAPDGRTLSAYWKPKLTVALVKALREKGEHEILNLLPLDASRCFDWKLIKNFADVYIANFKEYTDGGELRTPRAERLKHLRGLLLREIITTGITSCPLLRETEFPAFMYESDTPYPRHLLFTTA